MAARRILIIAPHPDDETLGCGGTLLRHRADGDEVHWLIVTGIDTAHGFSAERVASREREIAICANHFGFAGVHNLRHPATHLDELPLGELIGGISDVVKKAGAEVIYLPYPGDIHSDHRIVFDAALPASKWFRYGTVKQVLAYEVLSETEFNISPTLPDFRPNLFVDISDHLPDKLAAMRIFASELGEFPFPRSEEGIRALASYRGATAGFAAAEAFMTLREIR